MSFSVALHSFMAYINLLTFTISLNAQQSNLENFWLRMFVTVLAEKYRDIQCKIV